MDRSLTSHVALATDQLLVSLEGDHDLVGSVASSPFFVALASVIGRRGASSSSHLAFSLTRAAPTPDVLSGHLALDLPQGGAGRSARLEDGRIVIVWEETVVIVAEPRSGHVRVHAPSGTTPALVWALGTLVATACVRLGLCHVVHGSLVQLRGRHLLVAGAAASGKTTTALLLVAAGAELVTEDITYLGGYGEAVGTPLRHYLNIRSGTWRRHHAALAPVLAPRALDALAPLLAARVDGAGDQVRVDLKDVAGSAARSGATRARTVDGLLLPALDPSLRCVQVTNVDESGARACTRAGLPPEMITWIDELLPTAATPTGDLNIGLRVPVPAACLRLPTAVRLSPPEIADSLASYLPGWW